MYEHANSSAYNPGTIVTRRVAWVPSPEGREALAHGVSHQKTVMSDK